MSGPKLETLSINRCSGGKVLKKNILKHSEILICEDTWKSWNCALLQNLVCANDEFQIALFGYSYKKT